MKCNNIFNIINIIFLIFFLCVIFTGNSFNLYNYFRNFATNRKYEINEDIVFYISKNILSLPIIIIIYFILNKTRFSDDSRMDSHSKAYLIQYTDLKYTQQIPFLYLFNISSTLFFSPVITISVLLVLYFRKFYYFDLPVENNYFYFILGLFIFYLLLEILLFFYNQNNLYLYIIKFLYFFIIVLLLIMIHIYIYKTSH